MAFTANKLSVRERILRAILRRFDKIVKGAPAADPYTFEWSTVQRQPLTEGAQRREHEIAVVDQQEIKEIQIQNQQVSLEIELQFSSVIPSKYDPSEWANDVLTQISRKLNEDIYLFEGGQGSGGDQLAFQMTDTGNEYVVDGETDRRIEGVVFVKVLYKHSIADPRAFLGGT